MRLLAQRSMLQMGAVLFLAFISGKVVEVDGFVVLPHQSAGQSIFRHASTSLSTSTSTSTLRSEKGVYEINRAMDDLAEQCGDVKRPVVALASQVEDIYKQAKQKDIISFNVMLKAWGKACQSMERQKHAHNNGHKVTIHSAPSMAIYTPRDAAEHLTKHLLTAEEACQGDGENCVVVPDETSYNIAIDAWAKSAVADSTQVAERLLSKMIHNPRLEPSSITYNAVLDSHAHSSDPDSLTRMNKIWNHMQKLADAGSTTIRPNLRTVNMILTACVRKAEMSKEQEEKMACARHAQTILDDIKARAKDGSTDLTPDVMTYSIVMDAFARVGSSEAAHHAEELMLELNKPIETRGRATATQFSYLHHPHWSVVEVAGPECCSTGRRAIGRNGAIVRETNGGRQTSAAWGRIHQTQCKDIHCSHSCLVAISRFGQVEACLEDPHEDERASQV
ncbi:endonuclease [Fragilaria crotonensis]|nr:endonuclease [Fragilaria crotonensis]